MTDQPVEITADMEADWFARMSDADKRIYVRICHRQNEAFRELEEELRVAKARWSAAHARAERAEEAARPHAA